MSMKPGPVQLAGVRKRTPPGGKAGFFAPAFPISLPDTQVDGAVCLNLVNRAMADSTPGLAVAQLTSAEPNCCPPLPPPCRRCCARCFCWPLPLAPERCRVGGHGCGAAIDVYGDSHAACPRSDVLARTCQAPRACLGPSGLTNRLCLNSGWRAFCRLQRHLGGAPCCDMLQPYFRICIDTRWPAAAARRYSRGRPANTSERHARDLPTSCTGEASRSRRAVECQTIRLVARLVRLERSANLLSCGAPLHSTLAAISLVYHRSDASNSAGPSTAGCAHDVCAPVSSRLPG